jgi:nicotinamidase-related amidase
MQPRLDPSRAALLVIDVQRAFDEIEAAGLPRNNPDAVGQVAHLLALFRGAGAQVLHVRHASLEPNSRFRPDGSGYAVRDEARELAEEAVIVKEVNSAFIGTDLEPRLRDAGIETLVIVGATTNHCVETTTRMAGNLGFRALLVRDATWTFDRTGPDGETYPAALVHAISLANLAGEFATIVTTAEVEAMLSPGGGADCRGEPQAIP